MSVLRKVTNILWDLDGTLTDPRVGIIRCFQEALMQSGLSAPCEDELLWIIGPPIQQVFSTMVPEANDRQILDMVKKFRERFSELGMYENEVYAAVPEMFKTLKSKRNFLATSKPQVFAAKILSHFGLSEHFYGIYGSELDGSRSDKAELIKYILQKEMIHSKDVVMVGDRKHDIRGAKENEILSIGVTWGYGTREELTTAGADFIIENPKALADFLISFSN